MRVHRPISVRPILATWYASNPDVIRVWAYEADEHGISGIRVTVALAPVCDSDEVMPIWLSKCSAWQSELRKLLGEGVRLDWLDTRADVIPCSESPGTTSACLASIGWRDVND